MFEEIPRGKKKAEPEDEDDEAVDADDDYCGENASNLRPPSPDCHIRDVHADTGRVEPKPKSISFGVTCEEDWNQQIFKSDTATVFLPALQLEFPPMTQTGVNTLKGFVTTAANNLEISQEERLRVGDLDNFHRCRGVITKLRNIFHMESTPDDSSGIDGENHDAERTKDELTPFTIVLNDPAGNSFIDNLYAPHSRKLASETYDRTLNQNMEPEPGSHSSIEKRKALVVNDPGPSHTKKENGPSPHFNSIERKVEQIELSHTYKADETMMSELREEAIKFPTYCPLCRASAETSMYVTHIPHFKEVIIMCLSCEQCGYKSNEIKGGGAIPPFCTKITLHATDMRDLTREVLKSDTAGIFVPELDLELEVGGLNGVYTTVEGLLMKMHGRLWAANPFGVGDSFVLQHADYDGESCNHQMQQHVKYGEVLSRLKDMADGRRFPFTLILLDPLSNSFVGPALNDADTSSVQADEGSICCYETSNDDRLEMEEFQRTETQNEHLGLNEKKTQNY